jgi:toxin ParE1/3/4
VADYILDPCIETELEEIAFFIAKDNPAAAINVLEAAERTFQLLADHPGIGKPRSTKNPRLRNLRVRSIQAFTKYLIFYRPIPSGIQVLHVYHSSRNIDVLLRKA